MVFAIRSHPGTPIDKTLDSVYVINLVDVKQQSHAFQHLVLPDDVKYTLKAISCSYVKAQETSHEHSPDIVKGKGEGKIFLLHGPPGTGKTLSAEVVAELTKRPLLSLTCGDLGTTAEEVELGLGRYMSLGELWGAVVLLDEADIYLEARSINEVKRNSLVSGWSSIRLVPPAKITRLSISTSSRILQRSAFPNDQSCLVIPSARLWFCADG